MNTTEGVIDRTNRHGLHFEGVMLALAAVLLITITTAMMET